MGKSLLPLLALLFAAACGSAGDAGYAVRVNGRSIRVYEARAEYDGGLYYFANVDFKDKAKVTVRSKEDLSNVRILPDKYGFTPARGRNGSISFEADRPFRVSVERDGKAFPLMLFGNRPDKAPAPGADVIRLGPGYHDIPVTELSAGQTLYLEDGAVLRGAVVAKGDGITICGKGIITGEGYEKCQGPAPYMLYAEGCRNLTVRDITVTSPWWWTFVMWNCDGVLIDNMKGCCSNLLNDDALDICNSRNVEVRNCFFRCQDDIIAVKGMDVSGHAACENILVENCEVWTDRANIFRIGYECDSDGMRNITGRNLDVLHYANKYKSPEHYWANAIFWIQPSNGMTIEDCRFEDIRINAGSNDMILVEAKSCLTGRCNTGPFDVVKYTEPGRARNITFRNITVTGDPSAFTGEIYIKGVDADHDITGITTEDIFYFGRKVR